MPPISAASVSTLESTSSEPKLVRQTKTSQRNAEESELHVLVKATKELLEHQGVIVPLECDQFILRCLRVKNYNFHKAATLIKNYGQMLGIPEMRNVIDHCSPTSLRGLYEKRVMYPLAKRGPNGEQIICTHAVNWDPCEFDYVQGLAGFMMLFNFCAASSLQTQKEGIIFITDYKGWSFKMIRAMNMGLSKVFAQSLNSSTPAKIKAFHLINSPQAIKFIYTIVKPLLKSKMVNRIHFHDDSGTKTLREELGFLPESLSGSPQADCVDKEMLELLYKQDKYYQDLLKFSYPPY